MSLDVLPRLPRGDLPDGAEMDTKSFTDFDQSQAVLAQTADFSDIILGDDGIGILVSTGVPICSESISHVLSVISEVQMSNVDACVDVTCVEYEQITRSPMSDGPDSTSSTDLIPVQLGRGSVMPEMNAFIARGSSCRFKQQLDFSGPASRHRTNYTRCVTRLKIVVPACIGGS
jgi:hypothetical protein